MITRPPKPTSKPTLFPLGRQYMTPGVMHAPGASLSFLQACLIRHACNDFGLVDAQDWKANLQAIKNGDRILSVYHLPGGNEKLWIITEADRSVTTFLLPSEY